MRKVYLIIGAILIMFLGLLFILWQQNTKNIQSNTNNIITPIDSDNESVNKVTSFEVPILMYHYIRDASGEDELGKNLSVHPENFEKQIEGLIENDYVAIKMSDISDPDLKTISRIYFQNKKPIALTFDDGYKDAYTNALPVMKKYGFIGTFYIIKNSVGAPLYMTQEEINEIELAGNEIGSHTLSHPNLASLSEEDQKTQIFDAKNSSNTFCYPAGKYNDTTVSLVIGAKYLNAVTTNIGIANQASNIYLLPRVRVEDGQIETLLSKISFAKEKGSY